MPILVTERQMLSIGLNAIGYNEERQRNTSQEKNEESFRRAFGATADVCSIIFRELQEYDIGQATINKPKPKNFLMCMCWLKCYQVEMMLSAMFGCHEDTVRKWIWSFAYAIQAMKVHKAS
jgi:hypothetical protein